MACSSCCSPSDGGGTTTAVKVGGGCQVRHPPTHRTPDPAVPAFVPATNHILSVSAKPSRPLYLPQPYWAVHRAKVSSSTRSGFGAPSPWPGQAFVRGKHPPWPKSIRPVLALLAENALEAVHMMRWAYLLRTPVVSESVVAGGAAASAGLRGRLVIAN